MFHVQCFMFQFDLYLITAYAAHAIYNLVYSGDAVSALRFTTELRS